MNRRHLLFIMFIPLSFLLACQQEGLGQEGGSDGESDDQRIEEYKDEIQFIEKMLENEKSKVEELQTQVNEIEDENEKLKSQLLTIRQEKMQVKRDFEESEDLRKQLDKNVHDLIVSMNIEDHDKIEEIVHHKIDISEEEKQLKVKNEGRNVSIEYIHLDGETFIQQDSFTYDPEKGRAQTTYTIYSLQDEEIVVDREVDFNFIYVDDSGQWMITDIHYR
ncbi:hypothetical protein [Texcoconibacillus texcoconensis]|uniref:Chromosome segregation ATPase n=1 Tax=Texcoconibacillus texcoconensis TaxID=1095777 RepID=A0A840QSM4_9BACI|nr:hypothetical protein [Texcoconibacillus texcoconensis]MBB5174364.1 chromosome segregation ATPase [Texcoconibacillus texcoconensis]